MEHICSPQLKQVPIIGGLSVRTERPFYRFYRPFERVGRQK